MFNSPLPRLKIVFAVLVMTAAMAICAGAGEATIYRDCFRIEPGQIPHLVCTVEGLEGIDYAVDKYETNDWQVVIHGWGMDDARIKKAKPGAHLLDDNDMPSGVYEVTGTAQPFVFEFCNWYRSGALGSKTWYGYVSIALDANARLVILESALCNQQNVLTVTGTVDEASASLTFKTQDHGDWLELARQTIPADTEGVVVVPRTINRKPVRAIGHHAFSGCRQLTRIIFQGEIEAIGDYAFAGCASLKEMTIPSSVTNVGACVLVDCLSLGELCIEASLPTFGHDAFAHTGMTNLVLSTGITNINNRAFSDNRNLSSVTIPKCVQRIDSWSFEACSALQTANVSSETIIEEEAFPTWCEIVRYEPEVDPPAEVTFETKDRGGWLEIMGCIPENVTGWVVVPSEIDGTCVRVIGEGSFYMHEGITKITLPETVISIGASAFGRCTSLKECNIPASVTNIGVWAFGDTAISRISMPTSLEYIDEVAFSGCKNLSNVSVWPWTQVHPSAFDRTCQINRTGTVTNFSGFARDVGDYDVTNLMTWVGRENFDGVTEFRITDDYGELWGDPYGYSKLLHYIGMAPAVTAKNGSVLEAKYVKPRMEIASFDPVTRRITGRVVAQGGCRIAATPNPWMFGLRCYGTLHSAGIYNWENLADVSGYTDELTLGEFSYTIPEDDFSTNRFFRVELMDN